ncbi:Hsp20/alpha crystallin family protein [Corallococcus sp. H22C18031201]|nr:Hsp20/alpha crystallin family protein [Corallococcus sp. H22C18031201]
MADLPVRRGGGERMTARREWDPFHRMRELISADPVEELSRLLTGRADTGGFTPAFDVKETKDAYIFKADLPGVDEKDVDVTLTGDRLTVSGKREVEQRDSSDRFYTYERSFGSFSRSFTLPEGVDAEQVDAQLRDGVLQLTLPKRPEVQPKKIKLGGGPDTGKAKA